MNHIKHICLIVYFHIHTLFYFFESTSKLMGLAQTLKRACDNFLGKVMSWYWGHHWKGPVFAINEIRSMKELIWRSQAAQSQSTPAKAVTNIPWSIFIFFDWCLPGREKGWSSMLAGGCHGKSCTEWQKSISGREEGRERWSRVQLRSRSRAETVAEAASESNPSFWASEPKKNLNSWYSSK